MLTDGLIVAALGMGIVFTFLCILIGAMNIMSLSIQWLNKICPEPVAATAPAKKASSNDEEIAVAIAAAKALS